MLHDVGASSYRCQGVSASDDLAEGADVGGHPVILLCAAITKTEARDHLVEDQWDAVLGGDAPQGLQEAWLRRDESLERLDDDAGEFVLVFDDEALDHVDIVEGGNQYVFLNALRNTRRIGDRSRKVTWPLGRERHQGVIAHAMIAALELEDLVALAKGTDGPHGVEIGFRARTDETHLIRTGDDLADHLGELDPVAIVGEEGRAEGQLFCDGC